jgi:hypothetical protein
MKRKTKSKSGRTPPTRVECAGGRGKFQMTPPSGRRLTPSDAENVKGGRLRKAVPCRTAWSVSLIFTRLLVFGRFKVGRQRRKSENLTRARFFRDASRICR